MSKNAAYLSVLIVLIIAISFFSPFNTQGKGNVAIVDLDLIAAELGRNTSIDSEVTAFIDEQNIKLNTFRNLLRAKIEQDTKALESDSEATEEAKQALVNLIQRAEAELNQSIAQSEKGAELLRQKLVFTFRDEVKPIARTIAKDEGMQIVMIKANGMLDIAPEADISKKVVEAMLAIRTEPPKDAPIPTTDDSTTKSATE